MRSPRFLIFLLLALCFLLGLATACSPASIPAAPSVTPTTRSEPSPPNDWWQPQAGLRWQIQYEGELSFTEGIEVYNLDLFETDPETIRFLHDQGAKVICYFSAGTLEDWVPDSEAYPKELLGLAYLDWPGETWLDIGKLETLLPRLDARIDLCSQKGFDAIDPDNLDGWQNETGFALTRENSLALARAMADLAHNRGLAIGLKNSPELVKELVDLFDFMVVEESFEQGWSDQALPFLEAGKAVFVVEYSDAPEVYEAACAGEQNHKFSVIFKALSLDAEAGYCH